MKMKKQKDFGFIFFIHLIFVIAAWASPFFLNWKIILFFIALYYMQLLIFKDCILTLKQFDINSQDVNKYSFYSFLFEKLGFRFSRRKVRILTRFIFPWIILLISILIS